MRLHFGLLPGGQHDAWIYDHVVPELEKRGHDATAISVPGDDPACGLLAHAEAAREALRGRSNVVVVGHSMSGTYLPLAARETQAIHMVFLCAMVPVPGLSMIDQFESDGTGMITIPFDRTIPGEDGLDRLDPDVAREYFYHDCPSSIRDWALGQLRYQAPTIGLEPFPEDGWPDVPACYVLCREDRAVSPEWSRRVALERLGSEAIELDGGHSPFFSRPVELAEALIAAAGR